jgi:hypothetical protein
MTPTDILSGKNKNCLALRKFGVSEKPNVPLDAPMHITNPEKINFKNYLPAHALKNVQSPEILLCWLVELHPGVAASPLAAFSLGSSPERQAS